jgi:hypothetical protein
LDHHAVSRHLPAYDLLLGTDDGEIWARRYKVIHIGADTWDVLSTDGEWIAEARFTEDFLPYGIDGEWVLGVARDPYDVESVRLYRRRQ